MASGKRTIIPQANEGLSPKRLKGFVSLDTNSSAQSKTHVPYQVDSVGESPPTHRSCLTEEDAKKLLETLTRRSRSAVWAHYESEKVVEGHINGVKHFLKKLYYIYGGDVSMVQPPHSETSSVGGNSSCISSGNETSSLSSQVERRLQEKSLMRKARKSGIIQSDVDRYLLDAIEGDEDENFNILNWWRVNAASKCPILALIARDILAIPVSTIASESRFSTSGRIIDSVRSSLSLKMVEALICTQNWLRGSHVALNHEPTTEEVEFCERTEKEMSKNITLPASRR